MDYPLHLLYPQSCNLSSLVKHPSDFDLILGLDLKQLPEVLWLNTI
jgi:hypothetical protein